MRALAVTLESASWLGDSQMPVDYLMFQGENTVETINKNYTYRSCHRNR